MAARNFPQAGSPRPLQNRRRALPQAHSPEPLSLHRARKQEAQSRLAVARATVALDQLEREQWKAACQKFDCPTVVQKILVRVRGGETITQMSPTNAELLHETRRAVHPPEQVCRFFEFPDGMPPEYHSFTDREDYRREKGHTIEQIGPVSTWLAISAEEQKLGTPTLSPA